MEKIFVFANEAASAAELTAGAKALGGKVTLITSGNSYGSADEVYVYSADLSMVTVLPQLAALIRNAGPEMVLCEATRDGRLLAGYTAATMGVSPLCDVMTLHMTDNVVETTRLVYGGGAVKTEQCALPAVAVVGAGTFEAGESTAPVVNTVEAAANAGVELIGTDVLTASTLNLAAAKRVVGVGRGLSSADNIPALEQLASVLGAEIGCTRPVAEEEHWYTKDRYIGVSGVMLKPNFYLAVGISGQVQHMVGVNTANIIFAIDKNENAPIVGQADYTLVGDVSTVLPALIEKLR